MYFVASRARSPREFEIALLGFDEDARDVSTVRLDENFVASQIAPFPTGEFLISGWKSLFEEGKEPTAVSFAATFDVRGRFLRQLELPDDVCEEEKNPKASRRLCPWLRWIWEPPLSSPTATYI